jgi:hypothetical protein
LRPSTARQDRISEVRMAVQPIAAKRPHRDPTLARQRGNRRGRQTRGELLRGRQLRLRAVVVQHQVLPRVHDAAQPLQEDRLLPLGLEAVPPVVARLALDQRRLGLGDGVTDDLEVMLAERAAGADHVGDRVGQPELDGYLHRAVQLDDLRRDPLAGQVRTNQPGVRGGDLLAVQVLQLPVTALRDRKAELRVAEPEPEHFPHRAAGLVHQVVTGHPHVEIAVADVGGDVLGAQVEELDLVLLVQRTEIPGVGALPVTGLTHHRARGLGEGSLVRQGYAEHYFLS